MPETMTLTGYPSIDKPWLKYYSEEAVNAPLPECTIYECLWNMNKDHLTDVALDYFGRKITYQSLFEKIDQTAKAFISAGIKSGDVIIIASVTLPEVIYAIYALNRIGAIPNMVDPRTSIEGIRDYIIEVSAKMVITIDIAYPKIAKSAVDTTAKSIITLPASESMPILLKKAINIKESVSKKNTVSNIPALTWSKFIINGRAGLLPSLNVQPGSCCMIVHTGGTTGMPKGVMISNNNANAGFYQIYYTPITMRRGDVFLNIMPPFIAYGVILGIHTALCCGWKSVLIPKFDSLKFDKLLLKYKPRGLIGVPSYFEALMSSKKMIHTDLSFIKVLLAGGDKTPTEFEERINEFLRSHNANIHLSKGYSTTEASATATASYENTVKIGSNGVPLVKTVISAFEEGTDHELKYGELGEICISSPTIMMGYYGNSTATNEVIKTHHDGTKWVHTGDLGYVDRDGFIFIEGRIKRMIIRYDGFKIFPPFVENVILKNPAIESCCVVAKKDSLHGQGNLPVVFSVIKHDVVLSKDEIIFQLKTACKAELPEYSQPIDYYFLSELPLTPIGKVDYRALEEMAKEDTAYA